MAPCPERRPKRPGAMVSGHSRSGSTVEEAPWGYTGFEDLAVRPARV